MIIYMRIADHLNNLHSEVEGLHIFGGKLMNADVSFKGFQPGTTIVEMIIYMRIACHLNNLYSEQWLRGIAYFW
jgi:hypothetical protein